MYTVLIITALMITLHKIFKRPYFLPTVYALFNLKKMVMVFLHIFETPPRLNGWSYEAETLTECYFSLVHPGEPRILPFNPGTQDDITTSRLELAT